ncbi:hypothetical protein OF897_21480, partial [Chryseobacterium formosus]
FYRKTNNKPLDKLTIMVISKEGVFALVIDNSTLFYNMGGEMMTNREDIEQKYYGNLKKKANVTYNDIIKQVAKVLPSYGISLYKANSGLTNWSKMTYNPTTNLVDEIPCN